MYIVNLLLLLLPCLAYGSKPHVVFIVADDLGYNDVGFHNKDILSPHIDKVKILLHYSFFSNIFRIIFAAPFVQFSLVCRHRRLVFKTLLPFSKILL